MWLDEEDGDWVSVISGLSYHWLAIQKYLYYETPKTQNLHPFFRYYF